MTTEEHNAILAALEALRVQCEDRMYNHLLGRSECHWDPPENEALYEKAMIVLEKLIKE